MQRTQSEITALRLPPLPGQRIPQTPARSDLDTQSWGDPDYTQTHIEQHTHSCNGKHQSGECQRERGIPSAPGLGGDSPWSAMTVRDFWIFGEVVCEESRTMTQCCSGSAQRDFLKGELRHARKGPCAPLPCQQREKIEDVVCSY